MLIWRKKNVSLRHIYKSNRNSFKIFKEYTDTCEDTIKLIWKHSKSEQAYKMSNSVNW